MDLFQNTYFKESKSAAEKGRGSTINFYKK